MAGNGEKIVKNTKKNYSNKTLDSKESGKYLNCI